METERIRQWCQDNLVGEKNEYMLGTGDGSQTEKALIGFAIEIIERWESRNPAVFLRK